MKEITTAPNDNLVNSDKWTKEEHLDYFQERLYAMRSKRSKFEAGFKEHEEQETAVSVFDNFGELQIVMPLEQIMTEIYLGRTNGKVLYDIIPDSQADADALQPAKYALSFFLDGNNKDSFWKENKSFRNGKATYGTGIFFTGMRSYKDIRHEVKEGVELQGGTDLLNEDNFDEIVNETWMFFPKNVHVMDYYHDDAAIGNPDLQYAQDCIMKEKVSFKQFELMFGDNDSIDQDVYKRITIGTDIAEKNENNRSIHQEEIVLYYYFNRITKAYYIVSDEDHMLYQGIYLYDDGKLPFASAQHFPNNNCFYGRGLPERLMALKVYVSEILQDMVSGAQMANSVNLLTGNNERIGQDWSFGGRGANILQTTGDINQVQRLDTTVNLGYFQSLLEILYDLVVQYTGDNPRAPIDSGEKTLGQTEIKEANKKVRQSSVDEGYNMALDEALTMMLSRIKAFAPALLAETIKDSDGNVLKKVFPKIRIDNSEVTKEKGKIVVKEALGKYGYFELEPDVVEGVGVKVQTSSTSSVLPILERQRVDGMIDNVTKLANLGQIIPGLNEKLERYISDDFLDFMDDTYAYDNGKMKAYTEKDKIDKANREKIIELMQKSNLAITKQNEQPNQAPQAPAPQAPGLGQPVGASSQPQAPEGPLGV